jgi:hypothetical protein
MGGAEGKVAYIGESVPFSKRQTFLTSRVDTEGTFRPERIAEIAERFGGKRLKDDYLTIAEDSSRPGSSLREHLLCSCSKQ